MEGYTRCSTHHHGCRDAKDLPEDARGVGEEREGEALCLGKGIVLLGAVGRDPKDGGASRGELSILVTEPEGR